MQNKLPTTLNPPPIIDGLFEIRVKNNKTLSTIVPGLLFSALSMGKVTNLPINNIPLNIRESNEEFMYAPTIQMMWDNYQILVGDKVIGIGCSIPYEGWNSFKARIEKVVEIISEKLDCNIERYSIKYVDLLESKEMINFELKVGSGLLPAKNFATKIEDMKDGFLHSIQIMSSAVAIVNGEQREGAILDIDSIKIITGSLSIKSFLKESSNLLNDIHTSNKEIFFDCLKAESLLKLGAKYD